MAFFPLHNSKLAKLNKVVEKWTHLEVLNYFHVHISKYFGEKSLVNLTALHNLNSAQSLVLYYCIFKCATEYVGKKVSDNNYETNFVINQKYNKDYNYYYMHLIFY